MQPEIDVHGIALAEAVGFEPTVEYTPTAVFKTAALNLSATLPEINLASLLNLVLLLVICDRFFGRAGSVVVQKLIQGNQARRSQAALPLSYYRKRLPVTPRSLVRVVGAQRKKAS